MTGLPMKDRGTWKRYVCEWFGHRNIGTWNLMTDGREVVCLRCWSRSWTYYPLDGIR